MPSEIEILNRRLKERLGSVLGGSRGRFAWIYAPDQTRIVYDTDDRTVIKKSWASLPGPDGNPMGRAWLIGQWQQSKAFDHMGFGDNMRMAMFREWDYQPFGPPLQEGVLPDGAMTAQYCWLIAKQLSMSAEHRKGSYSEYLAEETWGKQQREIKEKEANRERAYEIYDNNTGAFGNCEPGKRDGYFSFQNVESGPESSLT